VRRIPRDLLHITLDDLPPAVRARLLPLLADLPQVPTAEHSAMLLGRRDVTLPALAVLARHVVQGLRDHNLTLAHDRARLRSERRKLLFYDAEALLEDPGGAASEAVLCLVDATQGALPLLAARTAAGLASFSSTTQLVEPLAHWRQIRLSGMAGESPSTGA